MRDKGFFIYFSVFIAIFLFTFRSLIIGFTSHLIDWRDYAFVTWVINQNINKLFHLNFNHFFTTNIFYPNINTAFFTDLFLPQSLIGLPIRFLTDNPITIFNCVFVITFILNYLATFLFWKRLFNKNNVSFIGSLIIIFGPLFFLQLDHFQMLSYWPFFFCLTFLYGHNERDWVKDGVIAGIFCAIQFLASAYLAIFLLFSISLFTLLEMFIKKNTIAVKKFLIILLAFSLLDGIFIKSYVDVQYKYSIARDSSEHIRYSAHLSDYLFTKPINSYFYNATWFNIWNKFDKNYLGGKAVFPGVLITTLAGLSIIRFKKHHGNLNFGISLQPNSLFYFSIAITGLVFSLGPRINFNGTYSEIPSLYYLLLRFIPLLESVRVTSRWSFLFYLGISYFTLFTLHKISTRKHSFWITLAILFLFLIEYLPYNIKTTSEQYLDKSYTIIADICSQKKAVLLEVPITHFDGNGGIAIALSRVTKYELSSIYHKCNTINGYSGYDLPSLLSFKDAFYRILNQKNTTLLINFLKAYHIDIIRFNTNGMDNESLQRYIFIRSRIEKSPEITKLNDDLYIIKR